MASSPYKFLDYYDIDEADSFFGRERETEILLSDVIATPLVLLFAKTGSGKTSLINAGVRPRLEELGYRTFYIRVERDPTRSAREALRQARLLPARIIKKSLDFQLIDTVRRLKRPIVLFFDQFEEFFLYIVNKSPEKARKFIANVAELYSNPDSGVHLVFSFREEFFVEMDAFREEIPTIFHNDSNLRLRWLDETQARLAITGPAKNVRLKIEEPLLERLLSDLSENGRVEPARLQIICDTLWRERARGRIRLAAYEKLGGATRILDWRLGQDINKALNDGQLELLRKLIPHLANTDRGTKYIRGLNELTESLGTTKESLRKLIDKLKGLHLVRESTRYEEVYVEWTSDYLAERTQYLEQRVHAISLRRMLTNGLERAKVERSRTTRSARRLEDRLWNLYLSPGEFDVISSNESLLGDLSSSEVEFLFAASLEHGARMDLWFQRAIQNKETRQKAWRILEDKIVNPEARAEQAENAVRLLGAQRTGAAMKLLKKALAQESLASTTISVLGEMRTKAAMKILQGALEREDLADQIINMLSGIRTFDSVQMLSLLLRDTKLGEDAERALERLSKVGVGKPSMLAKKTLDDWRLYQSRRARAESGAGSVGPTPRAEEFTGRSWGQSDWISLFHRIRDGYCTPFLGPRLGKDAISIHSNLAATLAEYSAYAGGDSHDFTRVAQFLSVKYDHRFVTKRVSGILEDSIPTREIDPVLKVLAALPMPLYITTNYDHFLERSLKSEKKSPHSSTYVSGRGFRSRAPEGLEFVTLKTPIVYHLYGDSSQPESLILTEDDYLQFLFEIGQDTAVFPPEITRRLARGSYLFIGHDQSDLGFRVLLQGFLARFLENKTGSYIQLTPNSSAFTQNPKHAEQYFSAMGMKIYWGSAYQFTAELLRNWRLFSL